MLGISSISEKDVITPKKRNRRNKNAKIISESITEYYNILEDINNEIHIKDLIPRSQNQKDYLNNIKDYKIPLVFGIGPAGVGKTAIAMTNGLRQVFQEGNYKRLIITRPTVQTDDDIGTLPGTLEDKMRPYLLPIYDICKDFMTMEDIKYHLAIETVEICPLSLMRGRTFKNCFILCDEMQNSTVSQMKCLLTRIGEGSKIVLTGDTRQHDRAFEVNGLQDFVDRIEYFNKDIEGIKVTYFNNDDIQRHSIIPTILNLYGE